jgi:glycosyltransferase involved in cell wall biosynthesis
VISDRNIVVLSSLDWGSLWQAPQEIAFRLGRARNRVLYVENLGVRSPRPRDARRIAARVGAGARSFGSAGLRPVAPGVHACSPLVLPPFGPSYRRRINRYVFLRPIKRAAEEAGLDDALVWTFLPTDTALDAIDLLGGARAPVVYTCLADFSELTDRREVLEEAERELLQSAGVVFARGPDLAARCRRWSDDVEEIQLGVSLDAFRADSRADHDSRAASSDARPVIGYVGALHRYFDAELAADIARARPDWRWVFVGPIHTGVEELAALPNVELVGELPHERLAARMRHFDVCTIPYRILRATETVLPAKLLEYLAMGRPVVSTRLPEVIRFDDGRGLVAIVEGEPSAFLEGIEASLAEDGPVRRAARRDAVASLDWDAQLERMSAAIERAGTAARTERG